MSGTCTYEDICSTMPPSPSPVEPIVTAQPTPAPTPCDAKLFLFDGNTCSNELWFSIANETFYNSVIMCCDQNFGSGSYEDGSCNFFDECNTLPPSPSPLEPIVTPSPVTPVPSPPPTEELETPPPTPSPSMLTVNPTPAPSFGATPTVSKETTGPPTIINDRTRGGWRSGQETFKDTECEAVYGGNPVVCVYVCTDVVSVYNGEVLISETATTRESECP